MGDSHDPHLAHHSLVYPPENEYSAEYDPSLYQFLHPTLSRPPSTGNMTNMGGAGAAPVQSLSRVASMNNFHGVPTYYPSQPAMSQNVYFQNGPFYSHPQQFHQLGHHQYPHPQAAFQTSPNQMLFSVPSGDYRSPGDMPTMISPVQPFPMPKINVASSAKPTKKSRSKRTEQSIPPPPALNLPASKLARLEKAAEKEKPKKKVVPAPKEPKPQRSRNPSSIYRGVSKCSKDGRWQARIRVKRQVTYLGRFIKEEDAARKYDEAARIHHGDKAVLNFPTEEDKQLGRKQASSVLGEGDDDDDESDA